jgi:serine/threonine protein kinase
MISRQMRGEARRNAKLHGPGTGSGASRSGSMAARTFYAVGAVLYELLTGKRPFRSASIEVALREDPPRLACNPCGN